MGTMPVLHKNSFTIQFCTPDRDSMISITLAAASSRTQSRRQSARQHTPKTSLYLPGSKLMSKRASCPAILEELYRQNSDKVRTGRRNTFVALSDRRTTCLWLDLKKTFDSMERDSDAPCLSAKSRVSKVMTGDIPRKQKRHTVFGSLRNRLKQTHVDFLKTNTSHHVTPRSSLSEPVSPASSIEPTEGELIWI